MNVAEIAFKTFSNNINLNIPLPTDPVYELNRWGAYYIPSECSLGYIG